MTSVRSRPTPSADQTESTSTRGWDALPDMSRSIWRLPNRCLEKLGERTPSIKCRWTRRTRSRLPRCVEHRMMDDKTQQRRNGCNRDG